MKHLLMYPVISLLLERHVGFLVIMLNKVAQSAQWYLKVTDLRKRAMLDLKIVLRDYFKHVINLDSPITHTFGLVKWFSSHPARHHFGYPAEVFCSNLFEISGSSQLLPVNRINSQFVTGFHKLSEENVLCITHLVKMLCLTFCVFVYR